STTFGTYSGSSSRSVCQRILIRRPSRYNNDSCMMRIFSTILVVYIAFLSLQPCDAMLSRADAPNLANAQVVAGDLSGSEDQDCVECSPFCVCSCCHLMAAFSYTTKMA